MMKNRNENGNFEYKVPFWHKSVAILNIFLILWQVMLPSIAFAMTSSQINAELNNPQYTRSYSDNGHLYVKSDFVDNQIVSTSVQSIESFFKKLKDSNKQALESPLMVPILNGDITLILPIYPLGERVGDSFVQSRFVRAQIYNQLNRNLLIGYTSESNQINGLYNNAYLFAKTGKVKFGSAVTRAQVNAFGANFIWPETRSVGGRNVLVPILHLTDSTIIAQTVSGHQVEFHGNSNEFRNITVDTGNLYTYGNAIIRAARNVTVVDGGIIAKGDLNIVAGGTVANLSSQFSAEDNVNIFTNNYVQKTLVHRYETPYSQGTRFGKIAHLEGGNIYIKASSDIVLQGATVSGSNIRFEADNNIILKSQKEQYSYSATRPGYSESTQKVEHITTKLSAKDSISLIAGGLIELDAAELHADKGVINILADQGIYIVNSFDEYRKEKSIDRRKFSSQESKFQTIAIRSALHAGKNIVIASGFGDIKLKAVDIKSGDGTEISAANGKVDLLLAKEQDHYFKFDKSETTFKIKTHTIDSKEENAIYNEIVGGVKVRATQGLTLELAEYDRNNPVALSDVMSAVEGIESLRETGPNFKQPSLSWMTDLYNSPEYNGQINTVYQTLQNYYHEERTSNLSPAAMAVISIAVAVAMGPAGAGWIGEGGKIALAFADSAVMGAAMSAGATTLATQAATSLASGQGLDGTLKSILSEEGLRSLVTSMATAGAMSAMSQVKFFELSNSPDAILSTQEAVNVANQAAQAVTNAAVSASITGIINGDGLSEFGDMFKANLLTHAANKLGEKMANEIKIEAKDNNWPKALKYITHAGAGCIYGAALAEAGGQTANTTACASGAGGAVAGEIIGDMHASEIDKVQKDLETSIQNKTNELLTDSRVIDSSDPARTRHELLKKHNLELRKQFKQWEAAGVDLAKLGAGFSAFLAGGDVNIAASAGENAAEHNAIWVLVIPVLLKAMDTYFLIQDFQEVAEAYGESTAKGNAKLQDLLLVMGIEVAASQLLPGSKTFARLKKELEQLNLDWVVPYFNKIEATIDGRMDGKDLLDAFTKIGGAAYDLCSDGKHIPCGVFVDNQEDLYKIYQELNKYGKYTLDDMKYFADNGYKLNTESGRFISPKSLDIQVSAKQLGSPLEPKLKELGGHLDNIKKDVTINGVEHKNMSVEEMVKLRKEIADNPARSTDPVIDNKATVSMGRLSEQIAEAVAEASVKNLTNLKPLHAALPGKGKSGEFDQLYTYTDSSGNTKLLIIEAKGGSSRLGSRMHDGQRVEQGSTDYVQSIVNNMKQKLDLAKINGNNSPEIHALEHTLEQFKQYKGDIEFRKVTQAFDNDRQLKSNYKVTNYKIGEIKL
ncbi:DUF637 domain-containing protein [Pseudoalteromonas luteoviolacea]|uniref:DUF637 domain-containing protein n=1 Tax=Pseudoalteromonas luteoviolacea S4060-1 TaxID=1365257 RepID=A0A167JAW6_9GAMM|nr:DUF637 domain-containing protein [Pseudoalteromonas luteoviolacea]KZN60847.1 hypothetical protein N478_25925 [Pseudoalteromonas luteoviolacea S4060-1]